MSPYQYIVIEPRAAPLEVVLTNGYAKGVHREAALANAAPALQVALRALLSMYERGYVAGVSAATGEAFLDGISFARAALDNAEPPAPLKLSSEMRDCSPPSPLTFNPSA